MSRPTGQARSATITTQATSPTTRPLRTRKPPPPVRGAAGPDGGRPPRSPGPPVRGRGDALGRLRGDVGTAWAPARGADETRGGVDAACPGWRAGATDGGRPDAAELVRARGLRAGGAGGGVPLRAGVTGISRDDWRLMRGSSRTASSGAEGRGRAWARPLLPTA